MQSAKIFILFLFYFYNNLWQAKKTYRKNFFFSLTFKIFSLIKF